MLLQVWLYLDTHLIFNSPIFLHICSKTEKNFCNKNGLSTSSNHFFFFFLLNAGKMLGGLGKEGNRLRRVERRGGRIRTGRLDSRTAHVPSKDKPVPFIQLSNVFSLLSPSIPGHAQDRSARACACVCVPSLPQNTTCWLRGILLFKNRCLFGNSHILSPVNYTRWVK